MFRTSIRRHAAGFSILILALPGCSPWTATQGSFVPTSHSFTVQLPQGWKMWAWETEPRSSRDDRAILTRDGLSLQRIVIGRTSRDQRLLYVNKPLADAESSYDIAEPILEDLRSNPNVLNQHVIEKASTSIGGRPGIKLVYDYQTRDGLIIKGVQYGVLLAESYYYLVYEAAARYYFPRDYDTFEKVKDSFKILGLAEAPPPAGFR